MVADFLHLVALVPWVGGLVGFALVAAPETMEILRQAPMWVCGLP